MDMMKLGRFLQSLRKEHGLTQEQLGEKLHVSGKTVSRWETGTYMPPVEMLLALSDMYGITINELLNGERIAPQDIPAKAEEALTAALKDVPFHLAERQQFWRRKWNREHRWLVALYAALMGLLFLLALGWENAGMIPLIIAAIATICFTALMNNAREGYVEHHLYDE